MVTSGDYKFEPLIICPHTISVGRCVILWEFLGKSVKRTFSCRKMYTIMFKKKDVSNFSCRFNVMVTSQSDVPIFGLFRA